QPVLRLVVVDSSRGAINVSDAEQNPIESQTQWLAGVLQRPAGERAVVVSETPSYSYGPGATTDTLTDSAAFETLMLQNHVDAVVSGRLGWNALYWATAAGVHEPCPGGSYPDQPPDPNTRTPCTATTGQAQVPDQASVGDRLNAVLRSLGAPAPPVDPTGTVDQTGATGRLPFVIAASAGGKFGPSDNQQTGSADEGYWHGFTVVRLVADGDPAKTIVEQRPVFDWIGMRAISHAVSPG